MKPNIVGFIFARGGSKGLPGKNIRMLAGKPLIAHAIHAALGSRFIGRVVVSTDDPEIARVARQFGADVPFMRPPDLATDHSPELLSWRHALAAVEQAPGARPLDVFVSVPATAPLRTADDVDACIEALLASDADLALTVSPARRSPYFNMVTIDEAGIAALATPPGQRIVRRQDAPQVYDIVPAAYAARPDFVRCALSVFDGRVRAVPIPEERAVDIDCQLDFEWAQLLLSRQTPATNAA